MNTTQPTIGATYGYARVSTEEQNEDRQLIALRQAGVADSRIFVDHRSGKDFLRPSWRRLTRHLRRGDLLIITSIDRLGRNYNDILGEWRTLVKIKGVFIRVLDMPLIDTTTTQGLLSMFISDLVLQILSFVAETEREHIRTRQREGIAAAKARGVRLDVRKSRSLKRSNTMRPVTETATFIWQKQHGDAICQPPHFGEKHNRFLQRRI